MMEFFASIAEFFKSTQITEQLQAVDAAGLFSNPYFLVPFVALVGYLIYKKSINNLVLVGLAIGIWLFSGSHYVKDSFEGDQISLKNIMPIIGFGVGAIGVLVYVVFIRSE